MKNRPSKFFRGFKFAFRGVIHCINNERNMRFHTAVMLYVLAFSPFFTLTKTQYAVLILTISSVISAEMLNTAAEELADLSAADYNPLARAAKDIAAGAVLVCAVFAAFVGIAVLWRPEAILALLITIVTNPLYLVLFILSLILAFFFIFKVPCGVREKLHKK